MTNEKNFTQNHESPQKDISLYEIFSLFKKQDVFKSGEESLYQLKMKLNMDSAKHFSLLSSFPLPSPSIFSHGPEVPRFPIYSRDLAFSTSHVD